MSANYDRTWVYYEAFEYISYIELAPNILITNRKSNKIMEEVIFHYSRAFVL
jgi:hypothetical protein